MAASKAMSNVKGDRVTVIHAEMVQHKRRPELLQYATTWGVSTSTIDKYIGEAKAIIGAQANAERHKYFGEGVNVLRRLRYKAENDGDYRAAIGAQAELNRMLGNHAPLQLEDVTDKERPLHEWPDDRLASRSAELRGDGGAGPH